MYLMFFSILKKGASKQEHQYSEIYAEEIEFSM